MFYNLEINVHAPLIRTVLAIKFDGNKPIYKCLCLYYSSMKKIHSMLIVCDAYHETGDKDEPLISGVRTHVTKVREQLEKLGCKVSMLHPYSKEEGDFLFRRMAAPLDNNLELVLNPFNQTTRFIKDLKPDSIFISTPEGPLGLAAHFSCRALAPLTKHKKIPYTASYHTNLDTFLGHKLKEATNGLITIKEERLYPVTYLLFKGAKKILVPTKYFKKKLKQIGLKNIVVWHRGVDSDLFRPLQDHEKNAYQAYPWFRRSPGKILLNFGRISIEKGIDDFLSIEMEGIHKVIIGKGPYLPELKSRFKGRKNIHFLGPMYGEKLAYHVRSADVMVFPSRSDTFGNVITESGASGVPTVAYDVPGPKSVIKNGKTGIRVSKDLKKGIIKAFSLDRAQVREITIRRFSWERSAEKLLKNSSIIKWK